MSMSMFAEDGGRAAPLKPSVSVATPRLHVPEPFFTASHDGLSTLPSPTKRGPQPSGRQVPVPGLPYGGLGERDIRVIAVAVSFVPLSRRDCPVVFKYDGARFKYGNVTTKFRRNVLYEVCVTLTACEEEAVELKTRKLTMSGSCMSQPVAIDMKEVKIPEEHGGKDGRAGRLTRSFTGEWLCDCGITAKKNIREWIKISTKLATDEIVTLPLQVKIYGNLEKEKSMGGFILSDIRYEVETGPGADSSGLRKCFYIPWMSPEVKPVSGAHIIL